MKRCCSCGEHKKHSEFYRRTASIDGLQAYCKECSKLRQRKWLCDHKGYSAAMSREWRANNPISKYLADRRYRGSNPEKVRANKLLNRAVKRGDIVKPTACSRCGESETVIHGHHEDYSRPLDVIWLCAWCHTMIHREPDTFSYDGVASSLP